MKNKITDQSEFSPSEIQLVEQLRQNSAMMVQVQSILEIVVNAKGPLKQGRRI